jgi:prepilin-type N-terminal cleavage/methylation domain-containing protein
VTGRPHVGRAGGFTLLEVLIAVIVGSLVMVLMTGSFGVSIRIWERLGGGEADPLPLLADLVRLQAGSLGDGSGGQGSMRGDAHRLEMVTTHTVRSLHPAGPVTASYIYYPDSRTLMYLERPLGVEGDGQGAESADAKESASYRLEAFAIRFVSQDGQLVETWEGQGVPAALLVDMAGAGRPVSRVIIPGFLDFKTPRAGRR